LHCFLRTICLPRCGLTRNVAELSKLTTCRSEGIHKTIISYIILGRCFDGQDPSIWPPRRALACPEMDMREQLMTFRMKKYMFICSVSFSVDCAYGWAHGLVVRTSALHAEDREFKPRCAFVLLDVPLRSYETSSHDALHSNLQSSSALNPSALQENLPRFSLAAGHLLHSVLITPRSFYNCEHS
jgi:hypothetical protein